MDGAEQKSAASHTWVLVQLERGSCSALTDALPNDVASCEGKCLVQPTTVTHKLMRILSGRRI